MQNSLKHLPQLKQEELGKIAATILGNECVQYFPDLQNLFPKTTEAEKESFKLLEYAYIGGRYDPKYRISKEDLQILAEDVKKLLEITKKVCEQKIY